MKADVLTLAATLNSSEIDFYTIPQYQRPYTWKNEHFETLWEDLNNAFSDYLIMTEKNENPEFYFLGPVVFVKNNAKRSYDIIDGQQRTTTFHVLLWRLYHVITDDTEKARLRQILTFLDKESKLKVSARDAAVFLSIRETNDKLDDNSKIAICANYFKNQITKVDDPNKFSAFLREYTQFIVIVAEDYGKAWDLFIGLNGKGASLNPTDLVKAFVCGYSDIGDDSGDIWEQKILRLKDDSTAYLLFLSRFKLNKYVSVNNLFKNFSENFPEKISTHDISEFSQIFYFFWIAPIETISNEIFGNFKLSLESIKSLRVLRDLDRRDFTSLIFKYADAFGLKSIFDEDFLKILASYQIRVAISKKRSNERKFVVWFKDIEFKYSKIQEYTESKEHNNLENKKKALNDIAKILKDDAPDDITFETYVKISSYIGNNAARIILRHFEEGERGNKIINDYELEHLMPQTGTNYWYKCANVIDNIEKVELDKYNSIINNIGNLFVIDSQTNNQVKNSAYDIKKTFYQNKLADWSIARITSDKEEWTYIDIEARAILIANWAKNYWKL